MKKNKILLIVSILLNIIFVFIIGYKLGIPYINNKLNPVAINSENYYYLATSELFSRLEINEHDIVFLGDSLTDRNEWSEFFKNKSIKNRGIDGDTTDLLLQRLDSITKGKPLKIFIMIGTNDLNRGQSIENTIENYNKIIKKIKAETPNTEIFVQSVLPINEKLNNSNRENNDIFLLNNGLKELADVNYIKYIDLIPYLSKDNELIENLTIDGVHLNANGYQMWVNVIKEYMY